MKRIKLVLAVAAVMAMLATSSALPATAQVHTGQVGPICQWFQTDGEVGYYPNGGNGYYDEVYGYHQWCQSPVYGWYVLR